MNINNAIYNEKCGQPIYFKDLKEGDLFNLHFNMYIKKITLTTNAWNPGEGQDIYFEPDDLVQILR